jgi:hypothetical protein
LTAEPTGRYRITLSEFNPDGTLTVRIEGNCSAFVVALTEDRTHNLRVLTDHDGPIEQRRTALTALTTHIKTTIGLGRAR